MAYLPYGSAGWEMFVAMVRTTRDHARGGHVTVVAGSVWSRATVVGQRGKLARRHGTRRRNGVADPLLRRLVESRTGSGCSTSGSCCWRRCLRCSLSPVALAHYWTAWVAPMLLLAAIGLRALARLGAWSCGVAGVAAAVLIVSGVMTTARVATLQRGDYARMAADVRRHGIEPTRALSLGTSVRVYFPDVRSRSALFNAPEGEIDLLVIEDQFAATTSAAEVIGLRLHAISNGLSPHRVGHLEYWYRRR